MLETLSYWINEIFWCDELIRIEIVGHHYHDNLMMILNDEIIWNKASIFHKKSILYVFNFQTFDILLDSVEAPSVPQCRIDLFDRVTSFNERRPAEVWNRNNIRRWPLLFTLNETLDRCCTSKMPSDWVHEWNNISTVWMNIHICGKVIVKRRSDENLRRSSCLLPIGRRWRLLLHRNRGEQHSSSWIEISIGYSIWNSVTNENMADSRSGFNFRHFIC